jgi:hypothetical protein
VRYDYGTELCHWAVLEIQDSPTTWLSKSQATLIQVFNEIRIALINPQPVSAQSGRKEAVLLLFDLSSKVVHRVIEAAASSF